MPHLVDVRIAAHHAAQVPSAWGATWLEPDPGHAYANLTWSLAHAAFLGRKVKGVQVGFRLHDFTWLRIEDGDVAELSALGRTVQDGLDWLGGIEPVGYDIPAWQGPLQADPAEAEELAGWFGAACKLLQELAAKQGGFEVRVWPHHFDVGTLVPIDDTDADPETARSVSAGMTPGDGSIDEPYFYVTPWPYPDPRVGPELSLGRWNVEGWFGAVWTRGDGGEPSDFLDEAFAACKAVVT